MKNTFILWKNIIANPFDGFRDLKESTKLFPALLVIIVLFLFSMILLIPIMSSPAYGDAVARVQSTVMAQRGTEMSAEQQAAMAEQLKSPVVRNITIVSAVAGGLISYMAVLLVMTLVLMLVIGAVRKEKIRFSLVLKLLLFTAIVSMVQSLVKMGITLSGDWLRVLSRVTDTPSLQAALNSPVSLAALMDVSAVGRQVYYLVDYITDVFNWVYYIFLYAGLKAVAGLEKKKALLITVIIAVISILIGLVFTFIG